MKSFTTLHTTVIVLIGLLGQCISLQAEPVPLSPEQMREHADAVVVVDVVRVTKTSMTSHQGTPIFVACLCIREVQKGPFHIGQRIPWETAKYEVAPGDFGGGLLYPGDQMLLFLERRTGGMYDLWRDDCMQWISRPPLKERHLPGRIGESACVKPSSDGGRHGVEFSEFHSSCAFVCLEPPKRIAAGRICREIFSNRRGN